MRLECPGLCDLQVNGFAGVDFNAPGLSADRVRLAVAQLRLTGVTRLLPTLITSSLKDFAACARLLADVDDPAIAGIHMEGPYISPEDGSRGAHPRAHVVAARRDDFDRRQEAARGRIRLVTLAPEVDGALALIEWLVASGVRVAIGHTSATGDQIADAVSAGATLSTHLGNGCPPILPRHPNVIWEQLAADSLLASIIVDGHHLPAATVKSFVRAKGVDQMILVTDATAAAGSRPGRYQIGSVECDLGDDGRVSLPGTALLAGSSLTLDRAIANTVEYTGLPVEEVVRMASQTPASYLGIEPAGTVSADWTDGQFRVLNVEC